jgi:spore coat protein U-like protein
LALRPAAAVACAVALSFCSFTAFGCSIQTTDLAFGSINPLSAEPATSASTITVTCTTSTTYTIALSAGGSGSFVERVMQSGMNQLFYQLYVDATHRTVWGDGTGGSATVTASDSGAGTTSTVYGSVPHQLSAMAGTYADSIVVTVTY